jgi:NitT/TauT family transport system permease protein
MTWFGTGELQKVMFLALAFTVFLVPATIGAVDAVPDVYLRTASTLGASRATLIFRVLVPVAAPGIWQSMRTAFGVGWTYLVLTEVVVRDGGLGDLIEIANRRGPREHVYLIIILITLIAWIADILWVQLGNLLFPYRRTR